VHALWALRRASGDLAVLETYPIASIFDAVAPRPTRRDIRRLVWYYERLGFQRSYPGTPIRVRAVAMHLQFGLWPLPGVEIPTEGDEPQS